MILGVERVNLISEILTSVDTFNIHLTDVLSIGIFCLEVWQGPVLNNRDNNNNNFIFTFPFKVVLIHI